MVLPSIFDIWKSSPTIVLSATDVNLARVPAGKPLLAEENIEGFLPVAREMAQGREVFALRVKGDSMVQDGILEGDYVVIQRQQTAENGDIVCALIDGEAALKKFYKKRNAVILRP